MLTARQIRKIAKHRASHNTPLPPTREKEKHRRRRRAIKVSLEYVIDPSGDVRIEKR